MNLPFDPFNDWAATAVPPAPTFPAPAPALAPVRAADKRVVNGHADINQLAPFKYPWAWEYFLKANRNH